MVLTACFVENKHKYATKTPFIHAICIKLLTKYTKYDIICLKGGWKTMEKLNADKIDVGSTVLCDSREKKGKNVHILNYFNDNGIPYIENVTFNVGDYRLMSNDKLIVDRKQGLNEVYNNLIHSHERFKRECLRAIEQGIELIILVEENNIKCLADVAKWKNPRTQRWHMINAAHKKGKMLNCRNPKKPPISSEQLMKTMQTFEEKYKIKFAFATKENFGQAMIDILTGRVQV